MYRTLAIADFKIPDDLEFNYWKHLFVNNIFNSIRQFEPSRVVLAIDSPKLWRKEIYDQYKAGRKEARNKSTINFEAFFKVLDKFLPEMKEAFSNIFVMKVDECEADDIIAVLAKERFNKSEKVILISTDKDFIQLLSNKNFNIYNPIKKAMVKSISPKKDLQMKILMGDKSDNIPAVKKGTGPATAQKIVKAGLDVFLATSPTIQEAYDRNKSIIDFDLIPKRIKDKVLNAFDAYTISDYTSTKVWQFLLKHRLEKLADDLNQFGPFIRKIK